MAPANPRILVIDDANVLRLYYRQILEAEGYVVDEAINGMAAMEAVVTDPFDLCIVDLNMPVMDGYAFLHALRREPSTCGMPALMTSTEAAPEDRAGAIAAGANCYLVKPVARETLARHVAAMLGRAA
jgi:two-component system chemotaxis response regulator CheY